MKILILQSAGQHKKNENFRECLCLQRAFTAIGIESKVYGPGFDNFNEFNKLENWCDIIFVVENYWKTFWFPDLKSSKKLKIFWSIDSHIVFNRHLKFVTENNFNLVLCSNNRHIEKWDKIKSTLFLNCYDNTLVYHKPEIEKLINIGFCGNIVNRGLYIAELKNQCNLHTDIFVIGNDMVNAINSYKIHWNKSYSFDVNYRCFETCGCKTLLLTNNISELNKAFNLKTDIVVYDSILDCIEKIKFHLSHPAITQQIAQNGYNNVTKNHTYVNRAKQFIEIVKGII